MPRCLVTGNTNDPLIDRQRVIVGWLKDRGVAVVATTSIYPLISTPPQRPPSPKHRYAFSFRLSCLLTPNPTLPHLLPSPSSRDELLPLSFILIPKIQICRYTEHSDRGAKMSETRSRLMGCSEISSGAWWTCHSRAWEMGLYIHGFCIHVAALQISKESKQPDVRLGVAAPEVVPGRVQSRGFKSLSGTVNKVRLTSAMLNLPLWEKNMPTLERMKIKISFRPAPNNGSVSKEVDLKCLNAVNPFHECSDYCATKMRQVEQQKATNMKTPRRKGSLRPSSEGAASPSGGPFQRLWFSTYYQLLPEVTESLEDVNFHTLSLMDIRQLQKCST